MGPSRVQGLQRRVATRAGSSSCRTQPGQSPHTNKLQTALWVRTLTVAAESAQHGMPRPSTCYAAAGWLGPPSWLGGGPHPSRPGGPSRENSTADRRCPRPAGHCHCRALTCWAPAGNRRAAVAGRLTGCRRAGPAVGPLLRRATPAWRRAAQSPPSASVFGRCGGPGK